MVAPGCDGVASNDCQVTAEEVPRAPRSPSEVQTASGVRAGGDDGRDDDDLSIQRVVGLVAVRQDVRQRLRAGENEEFDSPVVAGQCTTEWSMPTKSRATDLPTSTVP